jgi:hypothetical protein
MNERYRKTLLLVGLSVLLLFLFGSLVGVVCWAGDVLQLIMLAWVGFAYGLALILGIVAIVLLSLLALWLLWLWVQIYRGKVLIERKERPFFPPIEQRNTVARRREMLWRIGILLGVVLVVILLSIVFYELYRLVGYITGIGAIVMVPVLFVGTFVYILTGIIGVVYLMRKLAVSEAPKRRKYGLLSDDN